MPAFEFTALDSDGRRRRGIIEGDSPRHARERLRAQGYTPVVLETAANAERRSVLRFTYRLNNAALARLTRQLATLIGAGLPVADALGAAARQVVNPKTQALLLDVRSRVFAGEALHSALANAPGSFSDFYRAIVAAGEESGQLDTVLRQLAEHTESQHAAGQRLRLALLYPALLGVVSLAVVGGLLAFVVPQVMLVFESSHARLPLLTRGLLAVSDALRQWAPQIALAVIGLVVATRALLLRPAVRARMDRLLLQTRYIRELARTVASARFARTLALLTGSGIPLVRALTAARSTTGNLELQAAIARLTEQVTGGVPLHRAMTEAGVFPPVLCELAASGEYSGLLADMLGRAANSLQDDVDRWLRTALALIEPLMILLMGGIVLLIVLAILLPIFQLNVLIR